MDGKRKWNWVNWSGRKKVSGMGRWDIKKLRCPLHFPVPRPTTKAWGWASLTTDPAKYQVPDSPYWSYIRYYMEDMLPCWWKCAVKHETVVTPGVKYGWIFAPLDWRATTYEHEQNLVGLISYFIRNMWRSGGPFHRGTSYCVFYSQVFSSNTFIQIEWCSK